MVSKPKPGLGKGIVRTITHHSQHGQTHSYHHSISHPPSTSSSSALSSLSASSSSSSGVNNYGHNPIPLAPIVSHYHSPRPSKPFSLSSSHSSNRDKNDVLPGAAGSSGNKDSWPLLPQLPSANSVVNSPAYLALLPSWDTSTFLSTDINLTTPRFSDLGLAPIPKRETGKEKINSKGKGKGKDISYDGVRRYTTSSAPARAAVEVLSSSFSQLGTVGYNGYTGPSFPPNLLDFPFFPSYSSNAKSYNYNNYSTISNSYQQSYHTNFNDFFYTPPPPPSPGPEPQPIQPMNNPRPSEAHTVLSPTPLPPSTSSSSSSSSGGGISAGSPLLNSSIYTPPLTPPEEISQSTSTTYTSNLIFRYGASGSAKDRPIISSSSSSRRTSSPTPPPRPRSFQLQDIKAPTTKEFRSVAVGEDAYFTRSDGMCVADGVGGWARSGRGQADAGRWSKLLTHFCEREVDAWWAGNEEYTEIVNNDEGTDNVKGQMGKVGSGTSWAEKIWKRSEIIKSEEDKDHSRGLEGRRRRKLDPVEIMQRGFEKCLACVLAEGIHGSSTCLLALLCHSSLLIANLGDCCLLLVRNGEIIFRTNEMQHAFNFPLQVGTHSRDEPMKDAQRFEIGIEKEDVVVVGSDGLMDNLFDEDILECLAQFAPPSDQANPNPSNGQLPSPPPSRPSSSSGLPPFHPQKVSEALCARAREVSEEVNATTPFMVRAIEEGIDFVGGKKDDISVIVGVIGERGDGLELKT